MSEHSVSHNIEETILRIAEKAENLARKVLDRDLSITYLTIFSHHPKEYAQLVESMSTLGVQSEASNGVKFSLHTPLSTAGGLVSCVRIRKPDPYRSQLGCADVRIEDYLMFKEMELPKHPDNLRLIVRPEYEMIEFFDFDSNDVLVYALSPITMH